METKEKKKSKKLIFPVILVIIVVGAGIYGLNKYRYALHHEDTDDAQLEGSINPVLPRVSGYITEINFEDNQQVTEGQLLVKLDDRDLRIKVAQAEAALENAKANVLAVKANATSVKSNIATTQANIETANVHVWKANQDYNRYEKMLADKSVTAQQFDAIKADKQIADAQVEVTKKQQEAALTQADASAQQVMVAEANVKQKQADLEYAQLQLSYTTITAVVSGQVSKKTIQKGQFVQAGQNLFNIVKADDLWVVANFKETQLAKMEIGQKVDVKIDAFKNQELTGEVNSFAGATGAKYSLLPPDNATGNFVKVIQRVPVKIKLNADKAIIHKLRPGMSVSVTVNTDAASN
jgi:membrane fusion protein, multidrug efflux system